MLVNISLSRVHKECLYLPGGGSRRQRSGCSTHLAVQFTELYLGYQSSALSFSKGYREHFLYILLYIYYIKEVSLVQAVAVGAGGAGALLGNHSPRARGECHPLFIHL